MNILFSIYAQFKSKVDKLGLGLCASGARCWGDAQGNETGLARYGFEKSRLAKTKDKPQAEQRPNIKTNT
jgi:hypothetical protein